MTFLIENEIDAEIVHGRKGGSSGGGKNKGGSGSTENTLRSKARAQLVELIGEGPIKGLVSGDSSIFLGETAVRNSNGSVNFKNVSWQFNRGLPDDNYFNGNVSASTPHDVNVQVKKNIGPIVRTVLDDNADAVRLVMRIPALFESDADDGSMKPTDLSYRISYRNYNGAWVTALTEVISNERTTSVYQRQHTIRLPAGGAPWDIRVERLTDDSSNTRLVNELWWEAFYTVVSGKFIYPHTAALYLDVNAEDIGSSIPARAVEVEGMIVKVPVNYDPDTRTYTGLWNGAFKFAYTNNPAWVFYDLITNTRYGLGEFVDDSKVDKWSLYQIAQHCDQLVDTGFRDINGNMLQEPRYTFNGVINSRQEAFNVLRQIATTWRGMAFWSLGQVYAVADMPADPHSLIAPANVINGEFQYSGVALKAMHTVAMVSWNDPSDFYRPAVEVVINDEMLKKYGWREKAVTLTGCTSRGLAHRYGKWILDVEQHETETVTFAASFDQIDLRPGHIIAIADPNKAQVRLGGRLVTCETTSAVLDFPFTPLPGNTYKIMMVTSDGKVISKQITSWSGEIAGEMPAYRTVNFGAITEPLPQDGAMWVIVGSDAAPRTYRVLQVREEKVNEFKVTALFHDPGKYQRVESGIILDPVPYVRPKNYIQPPSGLSVVERRVFENGRIRNKLLLSWSNSGDYKAKDYLVTVDHPTRGNGIDYGSTENMSIEIEGEAPGTYTFKVRARGFVGNLSDVASFPYEVSSAPLTALPRVESLALSDNPGAFAFKGSDIRIQWENWFASSSDPTSSSGVPNSRRSPLYQTNRVKVYDTGSNTLLRNQTVFGEQFTYSFAMNTSDNSYYSRGPSRAVTFVVTVVDIYGRESLPKNLAVSNPPPAAVDLKVSSIGNVVFANWVLPGDDDLMGSVVHASTTAAFTPSETNQVYDGIGNSTSFTLPSSGVYFIKAAAYDKFGKSGLNFSAEKTVTTGVFVDVEAPATPTGLTFSSEIRTDANGSAAAYLICTWTANTEPDLAYYDLDIKEGTGGYVSFPTAGNRFEIRCRGNVSYTAKIAAVDSFGNKSAYSATVAHTSVTGPGIVETINTGSVQIDAGKIKISGATSLSDWRRGGDETKIDGGALSANTVKANAVEIGLRNISTNGIEFEHNKPLANSVSWTAGTLTYVDDSGSSTTVSITADSATWSANTLFVYWQKGSTTLSTTVSPSIAFGSSNVVLASYLGGTNLNAIFGRTVIEGSKIKTGTISATQIAANSISADKMQVSNLSAIASNIGTITSGLLQSSDGKMQVDLTNKRILIAD